MSLLTDTDIEKLLAKEVKGASDSALVIQPYSDDSLTPVGYDLRVGVTVATSNEVGRKKLVEGESFSIAPGATALISTLENLGAMGVRLDILTFKKQMSKCQA